MRSIVNKYFYVLLFLAIPITMTVCAQSITPQKLVFSKICAGTFNQFDATFNYSGFPSGTTFEVQLSDNTGSFSNPIATTKITSTDVTSSQKKLRFAVLPTLIGSENYKLRVRVPQDFLARLFLTMLPMLLMRFILNRLKIRFRLIKVKIQRLCVLAVQLQY